MTNLNVLPIDTIIGQLGKTYPNYADAKFVDEDILDKMNDYNDHAYHF